MSCPLNRSGAVLSLPAALYRVRWMKLLEASNWVLLVRFYFSSIETTSSWITRVFASADGPMTHAE